MEDNRELAKITVKGTLWNYTSFVLSKGLIFISTMILARILVPEDFGLLSMGLVAINYLDMLNELGVGPALIYQQGDLEKKFNAAFSMSLTVNVALTLLAFVCAPFIASFFREPRVVPIIQALSLTFVLSSIGSIHATRLKKELNFKKIFIPEIGKTIAKGGTSIVLALLGYGVWSLVLGQVAGILVSNILYWVIVPWRPRFDFGWERIKPLLGYGSQIILVDMLGMIQQNIDYLIIGRRMESIQLGYYTMAFRIPELVIINICHVVSRALFPAFSKLQDDLPALREGFLVTLRYVSLLTVPIGVGLYLLSSEFITLFFSDKWAASIPVMELLCLYAAVYSLGFNAGDIYKALGKPWILNALGLVKLVITIPVLWHAAGISIVAVAAGQLIVSVFLTILELVIVSRIVKIKLMPILMALQPALTAAFVMFVGLYFLKLELATTSGLIRMIVIPFSGVLLYAATLWLVNRKVVWSLLDLVKSAVKR